VHASACAGLTWLFWANHAATIPLSDASAITEDHNMVHQYGTTRFNWNQPGYLGFTLCEGLAAIVASSTGDSPSEYGDGMTLVQFPADRRTADIRRCADALQTLHGDEANRFWRSEMALFAQGFRERGADEGEIRHQAALFMHAVQMELQAAYGEPEGMDARA
jgi:hypothetical protein